MNIQTSSFARAGRLPDAVSVSRGKPKGWSGRTFDALAPEWLWIKNYQRGVWSWEQYSEAYNGLLSELDAANVCAALGDGAVMLCYCKTRFECHRELVSLWIRRETNLIVSEWSEAGQMSLFD
jgi:hypothetical protein